MLATALALTGVAWVPLAALAHGPAEHQGTALWRLWNADPLIAVPLATAASLYLLGLARLWSRAGVGRGVSRRQALWFGLGLITLVIALISPLDALTAESFWLHMVQHLMLIVVAPPLLVAGAPEVACLWALPRRWRPAFGRFEHRLGRWLGSGPASGRNRLLVVALATGMLWLWHVPALYDLALRNEPLHAAEHFGFIVTALLFWAGVLRLRPVDHADNGLRILSVAAMALQGGLLGALITFAGRPLYDSHRDPSPLTGLDPLVDQQIAGLLMWVPPAFLYIGVVAYLFLRWLEAAGRR